MILDTADILGKDDLNNLLGLYPNIEKRYYKLWLASTTVLEELLHKRIRNWAAFEMEKIKNDIHQYVINDSFDDALEKLTEHGYVIISGIPGIGKTTLARMLVYRLLAQGFEDFIYIPSDIDDAVELFDEERKQVFFFDDFLGSTVFEVGERKFDQKILAFIEKVRHSPGKRFILTTREYILSDALLYYEKFQQNHIDIAKCTLTLTYYTKYIRAAILYNHLADAQLPCEYVESLLENGNYKKLINHQNFNPRVIETFINDRVWESVESRQFMNKLLSFFDYPLSVWEKAFEKLEYSTRYILLTLATMPLPVRVEDWRAAFECFRSSHMAKLGLQRCDEQKWNESVRVLEDCFIYTYRLEDKIIVKLYNASVRDFLSAYVGRHLETCGMMIEGAYYTEQLYSMFTDWKWFKDNFYSGASHVIIESEMLGLVKETFLRLIKSKRTCELEHTDIMSNKVRPYDEFVFLQQTLHYFPQMCRNNPGLIEQYVTESMLKDDGYEISERLRLLKRIKLESCQWIRPDLILNQMQEELFSTEDYLKFIEVATDFEVMDRFENDDFKNRLLENVSEEISGVGSETDLESLEGNLKIISKKFPDWDLNFDEEFECQREKLSEPDIEFDDWEREAHEYTPMNEDVMIHEMFTSLRIDSNV